MTSHGYTVLAIVILAGCALAGCHRYGQPSPESCHAKYIRDGRGRGPHDTYEMCLAIATGDPTVPLRHDRVGELEVRIRFETSCESVRSTVLERTGSAATVVGVDACGQRLVFRRRLRRHLGFRSARNTVWEQVSVGEARAAPLPAPPAPLTQRAASNEVQVNAPSTPTGPPPNPY